MLRPYLTSALKMAAQGSELLVPALRDIFFQNINGAAVYRPSRYKVAYGGRGSGKSWGFARMAVTLAASRKLRVLCTREYQASIADSVHKLLGDQIDTLGLAPYYDVQKQGIYGRNGSEFIFEGIKQNVTKIKSMEGVDICWIEEGEKTSNDSLEVLIPTIRKPGSEIWVTFNPNEESDPPYQRFVVSPPPASIVKKVNYIDNPYFPFELERERVYLQSVDPDAYAHVWEGECKIRSQAQVLAGKWRVSSFEVPEGAKGPYFGCDWGFSQDPTTLVKLWIHDNRLLVEHEAYGVGVELDETPRLFETIPDARSHTIRADNARPESIRHLANRGFRIIAAEKGKGSVEDGIAFLRAFKEIIIHPRCAHAAEEAKLWRYKVDRITGDVLPALVDMHNHIWDAVRYALEPYIKKSDPTQRFKALSE